MPAGDPFMERALGCLDQATRRGVFHAIHVINPEKTACFRPLRGNERPAGMRPDTYLPVEYFKDFPDTGRREHPLETCFLSSGTTGGPRSRSGFSAAGLSLYRRGALAGFRAVLEDLFPGRTVQEYSLIPDPGQWPDSSLSAMLGWIAEEHSLQWSDGLHGVSFTDGPVWIFGTAWHYVRLFDEGRRLSLPPGSVVMETGGTKGITRAVSRESLYAMIRSVFQVPEHRIVSEYGMCELASQAWDWVPPGEASSRTGKERCYRFPGWVSVFACGPGNKVCPTGEGVLMIDDPLRIDYPWPLRTQDMARLVAPGSFRLIGRLQGSAARGCSLRVAEESASLPGPATEPPTAPAFLPGSGEDRPEKIRRLQALLPAIFTSPEYREALGRELRSSWLATRAAGDLLAGLPADAEQWSRATATAAPGQNPGNWLVIAPANHSIAPLQALIFGWLAGHRLMLRLPDGPVADTLQVFLDLFHKGGAGPVQTVAKSFRIGQVELPPHTDGILCFGTDETIAGIRSRCGVPVAAAGQVWSAIRLTLPVDDTDLEGILMDRFSLAGRGCLAAAMILLDDDPGPDAGQVLASALSRAAAAMPLKPDLHESIFRDHEQLRLENAGLKFPEPDGPWRVSSPCRPPAGTDLTEWIPATPWIMPVVISREIPAPPSGPARLSLGRSLLPPADRARGPLLFPCGSLNRPPWDGTHFGKPWYHCAHG